MKNTLKYILGFILVTAIIFLIGGGADFLASTTRGFLKTWFSLEQNDYLTSLMIALIFMFLAAILVPIVLLFRTRFRKPIVFISYKHIHENKSIELEKELLTQGFGVERVAFSSKYTHDEVVNQVRLKLQKSHVVVAIPDAEDSSFVDSELLAASVLKKPIILIQYQDKQAQPSTLLLGYPVFNYQCIQQKQFAPLFRFLLFATRSSKGFFQQVGRIFKQMYDPILLGVFGLLIGIILLIKFGFQLVKWFLLDVLEWNIGNLITDSDEMYHSVFIMLILGFTIYAIGNAFYTLQVARQITVTGKESYKTFETEFSYLKKDREMLTCIHQNSLEAKA